MPRAILHLLPLLLFACTLQAQARVMMAKIERVTTAVATLEGVEVQLDWPADAASGMLVLRAARAEAPDLGYRFRALEWQCRLVRDGQGGWHCEGDLHASGGKPLRLSLSLASGSTDATLSRGAASVALHRSAATPDDTLIDLARVPVAWVQALSSQAWADGRLSAGTLDGRVAVRTPARRPLQVEGDLALSGVALETPDGAIAGEQLGGRFHVDFRKPEGAAMLSLDGEVRGGQFLYGTTYVALPEHPVPVGLDAMQRGRQGWSLSSIRWDDGDALRASGSAAFDADAAMHGLDIELRSRDLASLGARYLSGWLGIAGLSELDASGALEVRVRMADGTLSSVDARLHDVTLDAPGKGLSFAGLDGDLRLSGGEVPIDSELRWRSGALQGIAFGPATLPWRSAGGLLHGRAAVVVPVLGGQLRFDDIAIQPPAGEGGLQVGFGLALQGLQLGELSQALGGPAFRGTLDGSIPAARYAGDRIDFDGGLSMQVFDGSIEVTALSMERPFGVAPTLSADFALHDLDLLAITDVFDFGSVSGRLDGRIDDLRLVDWTPVTFDAELHTVRRHGVRQRISQRAVQNISSVGDASFVGSLQARLIGLFDDFGYSRIGISCRLANQVCAMGGLHSSGDGFTIVEGAGIPRLDVVGFHRDVDWPTLVERLAAVGSGEVAPVFD